ncbi:MAG: hypothetical protein GX219_06650 [Tissierellia bacterium]|nr:hypothetical protein [Tissierellia bacterium]
MKRGFIFFLILLIVAGTVFATGTDNNKVEDEEIEDKLFEISEEEKKILEDLFLKKQEIDALKVEELKMNEAIGELEKKIEALEIALSLSEDDYQKNLDLMEKVLVSYQMNGSGSFFKMFFSSESLSELLTKLNIFREFSKNTEGLLKAIEKEMANIEKKKEDLQTSLADLGEKKKELDALIAETEEKIKKNEEALAALKGDRAVYEERLKYIDNIMIEFEATLSKFTVEFNKLINEGYFPDSMIEQDISLKGIRGIIKEDEFNDMISKQDIPAIKLVFGDGFIQIESEEYDMILKGHFEVEDGTRMVFVGEEGTFKGMELRKETIENLLAKGYLDLEFKPLLGKNKIKKVESREGFLDIYLSIKLF